MRYWRKVEFGDKTDRFLVVKFSGSWLYSWRRQQTTWVLVLG